MVIVSTTLFWLALVLMVTANQRDEIVNLTRDSHGATRRWLRSSKAHTATKSHKSAKSTAPKSVKGKSMKGKPEETSKSSKTYKNAKASKSESKSRSSKRISRGA